MDSIAQQRRRLEREILILICEFERRTGVAVRDLDLRRSTPEEGSEVSIPDAVEARLEVPDTPS